MCWYPLSTRSVPGYFNVSQNITVSTLSNRLLCIFKFKLLHSLIKWITVLSLSFIIICINVHRNKKCWFSRWSIVLKSFVNSSPLLRDSDFPYALPAIVIYLTWLSNTGIYFPSNLVTLTTFWIIRNTLVIYIFQNNIWCLSSFRYLTNCYLSFNFNFFFQVGGVGRNRGIQYFTDCFHFFVGVYI